MVITKADFVFTTKLKIGADDWIVLREPSSAEFQKLSAFKNNENSEKIFEEMRKLFPACVVDSSFENEDGSSATGEQIYKLLDKSSSLMIDLISRWIQALPFQSK